MTRIKLQLRCRRGQLQPAEKRAMGYRARGAAPRGEPGAIGEALVFSGPHRRHGQYGARHALAPRSPPLRNSDLDADRDDDLHDYLGGVDVA